MSDEQPNSLVQFTTSVPVITSYKERSLLPRSFRLASSKPIKKKERGCWRREGDFRKDDDPATNDRALKMSNVTMTMT